jgi:hypothetical protein
MLAAAETSSLDSPAVKSRAPAHAGREPHRVVAVGDTIISEQGLVAIIGRDPRYHVCGAAHTFEEANKLVRQRCAEKFNFSLGGMSYPKKTKK